MTPISTPKKIDLSNRLFVIIIVLTLIISAFSFLQMAYQFKQLDSQAYNQITVSGEGKAYAVSDIATITLGIKTEGEDVKKITEENVVSINKIIAGLKELNIESKDIKTTQYSLSPQYDWTEEDGRVLVGYTISQNVEVKIRDFTKTGDVLNMATENGVNVVSGLQFSIEDTEKFKSQAREDAIAQAKEKAETLAKQSGIKLGKIVNVYEDFYAPSISYVNAKSLSAYGGGVMEDAMPSAEIEAGQEIIKVTISLTYKIK
jgi:hypothetical protein